MLSLSPKRHANLNEFYTHMSVYISKTFCVLMQRAGITMMYLFKSFILQHVDNLLRFIFIKDVLV